MIVATKAPEKPPETSKLKPYTARYFSIVGLNNRDEIIDLQGDRFYENKHKAGIVCLIIDKDYGTLTLPSKEETKMTTRILQLSDKSSVLLLSLAPENFIDIEQRSIMVRVPKSVNFPELKKTEKILFFFEPYITEYSEQYRLRFSADLFPFETSRGFDRKFLMKICDIPGYFGPMPYIRTSGKLNQREQDLIDKKNWKKYLIEEAKRLPPTAQYCQKYIGYDDRKDTDIIVRAFILDYSREYILLVQELKHRAPGIKEPGKFNIPGGHVKEGENPDDAILREVCEEVGINLFEDPNREDIVIYEEKETFYDDEGEPFFVYIYILNRLHNDIHFISGTEIYGAAFKSIKSIRDDINKGKTRYYTAKMLLTFDTVISSLK